MNIDWRSVALTQTDSIKLALEVIDRAALRVALVVDSEDFLLGVLTDGDVRRGLLEGVSIDQSVGTIMNRSPKTAASSLPKTELIQMMESLDILVLPLVDDGKVVGLETMHNLNEQESYETPIFLMAGGFGTRLRPLTDHCPKPMLEVGGKPILETVIRSFKKAGFSNFYISTHYLPEVIEDYFGNGENLGVKIQYIYEEEPLGTGGALSLLPNDLPDSPVIMMNGDVLTNVDFEKLLAFHELSSASATMCVREYDYQVPFGVISGNGQGKITKIVEKPVQSFFINAGIYVISSTLIKSLHKNTIIDMPSLLEREIEQGRDVSMFPIHEYWLDIGRMDDFHRAQVDVHELGLI